RWLPPLASYGVASGDRWLCQRLGLISGVLALAILHWLSRGSAPRSARSNLHTRARILKLSRQALAAAAGELWGRIRRPLALPAARTDISGVLALAILHWLSR